MIRNQSLAGRPRFAKLHGFSLIELMITVLILSIIIAVAIPSYSNYVRKGRRAEAKSALLDMAALEERYYSTQNVYSGTATDLGYPSWPATVGSGYYTVAAPTIQQAVVPTSTLPGGTPAYYIFVATPTGDQTKDTQCATFTVTNQASAVGGPQTAQNSAGVDNTQTCWR